MGLHVALRQPVPGQASRAPYADLSKGWESCVAACKAARCYNVQNALLHWLFLMLGIALDCPACFQASDHNM